MEEDLKKTPHYQQHIALGGRMVPYAGHSMPVMYRTIREEYDAVRGAAGIFDISHMVPVFIEDSSEEPKIIEMLNSVTCREVSTLSPGKLQYNAFIVESGGVLDDITIYCFDRSHYLVLANGANRKNVEEYLAATAEKFPSVKVTPVTDYSLLALQGKKGEELLNKCDPGLGKKAEPLFFYECAFADQQGPWFISRSGYSGEDGFEILLPAAQGQKLWDQLVDAGVVPCGLGSRDLLRMEMFYPLYGNELSIDKTPLESGISWIVSRKKSYAGSDKMVVEPKHKTMGFIMKEKGAIPRSGFDVYPTESGEQPSGKVTSGGFSFNWDRGFGILWVDAAVAVDQSEVFIDIRGKRASAVLHSKSPWPGSVKRKKR